MPLPTAIGSRARAGELIEVEGRRPASYEIFDIRNNTRRSEPLERVNEIRGRIAAWRAADYPGATAVTRRLLEHWNDRTARLYPFYFCQIKAIETLIWWVEGSPEFRQGIFLPGDGGPWERLCSKMATGTGKTLVMGMIVVWQVANALTYSKRKDFSQAMRPTLAVDWSKVPALTLDPAATPVVAEIAPALGGAADLGKITRIDLELLPEEFRLQRLVFRAAQKAFEQTEGRFKGQRDFLAMQLIRLVETFLACDKLDIPSLFHQDEARRRILIALNLDGIVQHLMRHVEEQNRERLEPVFDEEMPLGSTRAMHTWYTTKTCHRTQKSQISHMLADSAWEQHAANLMEMDARVLAFAKNDHLGFQVFYLWNGVRRRYLPDFLIRLVNGKTLVLEIKGEDSEQNHAKRAALDAWVSGVNARGGFGIWCADVAFKPREMADILARHAA